MVPVLLRFFHAAECWANLVGLNGDRSSLQGLMFAGPKLAGPKLQGAMLANPSLSSRIKLLER